MQENEDIFRKNLRLLSDANADLSVIRAGIYHEAAYFAKQESEQKNEPLTPEDAARLYRGRSAEPLISPDFAEFCREFTDSGSFSFIDTYSDEDWFSADTVRIAYMQNTFSDRAYRIFERVFERVFASYFPSFREVCEEVYYGRSTYGILPVSSSTDGQLVSFRRLQSKYDLKIALEADVEMNDDTVMRFALLKKGLATLPGSLPDLGSSWRYMDVSAVISEERRVGEFLSAIERLGAVIMNISSAPTYPTEHYGAAPALTVQLDITGASPDALYLFLEAAHIRYEVFGIYDLLT